MSVSARFNFAFSYTCVMSSVILSDICSTGHYESDSMCVECPVGQYKPSSGNETCTNCPQYSTTLHTGANNSGQCCE